MIPVTITNPKSKKSVTINMIVDTGWEMNQVTSQYAAALGYNSATDAVLKKPNENMYIAQVKIGKSLKPIQTMLNIAITGGLNVFGALWMRQFNNFIITKGSVTATDSTGDGGTLVGVNKLMANWQQYIHGIVGGPMLAATNKKQALFAA